VSLSEMATVIYAPAIDWNFMKQRPQQLMTQLARHGHRVFYCNRTTAAREPEELMPGLTLVHDHERWLAESRRLQVLKKPVILWCTMPHAARELERYAPDVVVYDCADEFPEWASYEREMLACADVVICSSERLERRLRKIRRSGRIALVRNGYDPELALHLEADANTQKLPPSPPDLPCGKLIGYVGAWAPWVDAALLLRLARSLSGEERILVVGPEFGRKFIRHERIAYVGHKPHSLLPAYLRSLSVCLIPFKPNLVTLAANPIKAYEYAAAGKPIVATELPECVRMAPFVDIASGADSYIRAVKLRLNEPGDAGPRRQFALSNTWQHRYRQIESFLPELRSSF
jgi:teichuronic acid biosynthesis glycosyltransferase TuaH